MCLYISHFQAGEADIHPVSFTPTAAAGKFLSADEDSIPLTILSQPEPGSYSNPRNYNIIQFVSLLGNHCDTNSHSPSFHTKVNFINSAICDI